MNDYKRLKDYISVENGIFKYLDNFDVPWKNSISKESLDLQYMVRSGSKIPNTIFDLLSFDNEMSDSSMNTIASMLYYKYITNWRNLYAVLESEYNPIENYNMVETETIGNIQSTHNLTVNSLSERRSHNATDTIAQSLERTGTISNVNEKTDNINTNGSQQNNVFGFNSNTATQKDSNISSQTDINISNSSDTQTNNTTDTTSGNNTTNISEENTNNVTGTTDSTANSDTTRTLTRSGNIGVTTTQQMLQSTIDLWQWNFFENVMKDIDNELTLGIY